MNTHRTALLAITGLMVLAAAPAHALDAAWSRKVREMISANYSYPRSAQLRRQEGSAKIKIAFSGSGKVLSVDLIQSTGSSILDREAVRIPMKIGSYPAPPNGASAQIVIPLTWRMD